MPSLDDIDRTLTSLSFDRPARRMPARVTKSLGEDLTHDETHEFAGWIKWEADRAAFSDKLFELTADGWDILEEPTVHTTQTTYRFTAKLTRNAVR